MGEQMKYRSDRAGKIRWWVWAALAAAFLLGVAVGFLLRALVR